MRVKIKVKERKRDGIFYTIDCISPEKEEKCNYEFLLFTDRIVSERGQVNYYPLSQLSGVDDMIWVFEIKFAFVAGYNNSNEALREILENCFSDFLDDGIEERHRLGKVGSIPGIVTMFSMTGVRLNTN